MAEPYDVLMLTVWRRDGMTYMRCSACEMGCETHAEGWPGAQSRMPCTHGMVEASADEAARDFAADSASLAEYEREFAGREGRA